MAGANSSIGHLLRRAGFGGRPDEYDYYGKMSTSQAVDALVNFDTVPDDVDAQIGKAGYLSTTSNGAFSPNTTINDARQRWIFRMVHSNRPLQEKMTLFWHNHFATGYLKVAGATSAADGTRYMAAKASEDANHVRGQVELLRDSALGNFRDILMNIAKDTAMLYWLDGRTNTKTKPQENFGREIMELFTVGVGNYTESDVYAAARVFTGWNLARAADGTQQFSYVAAQHDTTAKSFSFPVYGDGSKTIPSRSAADGVKDGEDFINGLAGNPMTARYLAGKLWKFFVSEFRPAPQGWINRIANTYLASAYEMRPVLREVLSSSEFWDPSSYWARYAWPIEFVVRAIKEVGWSGFSVELRRHAVVEHGPDSVRAAGRRGLGCRSDVVCDRRHAGADEFRLDAGGQSEIQSCDDREECRPGEDARQPAGVLSRSAFDRAARFKRHVGIEQPTCARQAPGPAATRRCSRNRQALFT